jgi:hypothetical protein
MIRKSGSRFSERSCSSKTLQDAAAEMTTLESKSGGGASG